MKKFLNGFWRIFADFQKYNKAEKNFSPCCTYKNFVIYYKKSN